MYYIFFVRGNVSAKHCLGVLADLMLFMNGIEKPNQPLRPFGEKSPTTE
jgi:hypothetical protein